MRRSNHDNDTRLPDFESPQPVYDCRVANLKLLQGLDRQRLGKGTEATKSGLGRAELGPHEL